MNPESGKPVSVVLQRQDYKWKSTRVSYDNKLDVWYYIEGYGKYHPLGNREYSPEEIEKLKSKGFSFDNEYLGLKIVSWEYKGATENDSI